MTRGEADSHLLTDLGLDLDLRVGLQDLLLDLGEHLALLRVRNQGAHTRARSANCIPMASMETRQTKRTDLLHRVLAILLGNRCASQSHSQRQKPAPQGTEMGGRIRRRNTA